MLARCSNSRIANKFLKDHTIHNVSSHQICQANRSQRKIQDFPKKTFRTLLFLWDFLTEILRPWHVIIKLWDFFEDRCCRNVSKAKLSEQYLRNRKHVPCFYRVSWRFSRYSAPIHWLVHGHMTSNNETLSRQMPWAGNIAKTMTSNGKQFTVTREMLTAVACDR